MFRPRHPKSFPDQKQSALARRLPMPRSDLANDREYQEFWSHFRQMAVLVERGPIEPAIQIMAELRKNPRRADFDPSRQADYSYAVLLLGISDEPNGWMESAEILRDLLRAQILEQSRGLLCVELSAALGMLGD